MENHLDTEELGKENKNLKRQLRNLESTLQRNKAMLAARTTVNLMLESERQKMERNMNLLLENSADIILLFDKDSRFSYFTDTFLKAIGLKDFSFVSGRHFSEVFLQLVSPEWVDFMQAKIDGAMEQRSTVVLHSSIDLSGGSRPREYDVQITPMVDRGGELEAFMILLHDITDIMHSKRQAESANIAKSQFLATMSHEIRTPMNAILGMTELIMRENTTDSVLARATDMRSACRGLLAIINDILDISKIESGKLEIVPIRYRIASLLMDVISIVKARADNKDLPFVVNIDASIPSEFYGDELRIKQILLNLLTNAVKFTNEGQITLSVSGQTEGDVCQLTFAITDTGVGIKPEDMPKIFVLFQQVDTKRNRDVEGTGLGLSISKQLVEMMGGTLDVESAFGVGSTFTVKIRQDIANFRQVAELKQPKRNAVLVYENRPVILNSVVCALDSLGCRYEVCSNRSEMHRLLDTFPCDYIFIASLYVETVQDTVARKQPQAVVVVLNGDGEPYYRSNANSVSMPIHCLQIANIFFGKGYEDQGDRASSALVADIIAPNAKVLVVDDNSVNLKVAVGLLNLYKIQADTASCGQQAVEMVRETGYDLVFMDHMMPEMDGIDTTIAIRKLGPTYARLPIVALTANTIGGVKEMFIAEGLDDFLPKPIEMSKLDAILKKWLPGETQQAWDQPVLSGEACCEICGVDTRKGVRNSGGFLEYYNEILSIYVADSENRLAEIKAYHRKGDIKAFTICIHALKSASANIGADGVSNMAMELESAGKSSDIGYIDANLRHFTDALAHLLENIQSYLDSIRTTDVVRNKAVDMDFLRSILGEIEIHMQRLDLESAESLVKELEPYQWTENILVEISRIRESLAVFDYDTVEAAIVKLKVLYGTA